MECRAASEQCPGAQCWLRALVFFRSAGLAHSVQVAFAKNMGEGLNCLPELHPDLLWLSHGWHMCAPQLQLPPAVSPGSPAGSRECVRFWFWCPDSPPPACSLWVIFSTCSCWPAVHGAAAASVAVQSPELLRSRKPGHTRCHSFILLTYELEISFPVHL